MGGKTATFFFETMGTIYPAPLPRTPEYSTATLGKLEYSLKNTLFCLKFTVLFRQLCSNVPNRIKNLESFSVFKKELKSFSLERSFYTINEFVSFD
jgi:hypothetical protein